MAGAVVYPADDHDGCNSGDSSLLTKSVEGTRSLRCSLGLGSCIWDRDTSEDQDTETDRGNCVLI